MNRIFAALFLTFAPFMALAYHYAAKALLSETTAARFTRGIRERDVAIYMSHVNAYRATLIIAGLFGVFCAFLLALEIARLLTKETPGVQAAKQTVEDRQD